MHSRCKGAAEACRCRCRVQKWCRGAGADVLVRCRGAEVVQERCSRCTGTGALVLVAGATVVFRGFIVV